MKNWRDALIYDFFDTCTAGARAALFAIINTWSNWKMTVRVVQAGTPEEVHDLDKAKAVADTLAREYPNHPWVVYFQGRALIVRHMAIHDLVVLRLGQSGFGAVLKHGNYHTAADLRRDAVLMGGQMLEAFHLPRGAWDGREPTLPSGWDKKYAKQGFRDRIIT